MLLNTTFFSGAKHGKAPWSGPIAWVGSVRPHRPSDVITSVLSKLCIYIYVYLYLSLTIYIYIHSA